MFHIIQLKTPWDCESWYNWSQTRTIQWLLLSLLLKIRNHTFMFLFKSCHEYLVQGSLGRRSHWIQVSMAFAQCCHFFTILYVRVSKQHTAALIDTHRRTAQHVSHQYPLLWLRPFPAGCTHKNPQSSIWKWLVTPVVLLWVWKAPADKLKQEETDGPLILHTLTPAPASSLLPCWAATSANVFLIAAALKQMN